MASRISFVPSCSAATRTASRHAARRASLVALCLATALGSGCNDPELEKQAAFERQFNAVAADYAKTLGDRPDLLSANPTDESIAALRAVADRAKGLSGGSAGQQAAARTLAASVYRTSASIELARAAWIESGQEIVRDLAMSASGLAADLESVASAAEALDLSDSRSKIDGQKSDGDKAMRALQEAVRQLEGPANKLADDVSKGTARLSNLGQEVAVLLRKARESSPAAGLALVEEAAAIKAEARTLTRKVAEGSTAGEMMMAESRLVNAALRAAQGLQSSAGEALELLNGFEADIDGQAAKSREMAAGLRRASENLMKSVADERAGALKAAYDAAATDLESASADASSDALRNTLVCEDLRLRVTQLTGIGSQGRMLLSAGGPSAAGLAEVRTTADAAIATLKEKANAAAEQYANAGEDPATAGLKSYADGVKKMADNLTADKLLAPPAFVEVKAAANSGRSGSGGGGGSGAGAAADGITDLNAFIAQLRSAKDPSESSKLVITAMDDSTPTGKAMQSMASSMLDAMKPLFTAMTEKFGAEAAAKLAGDGGGGGGGLGGLGSLATITEKSNDGSTAIFSVQGGNDLTFVKTPKGWKLDMLAGMDDAQADQIAQMAPMMGMIIAPMKKMAETIAAKIRAGEYASAEEVQAAMQQELMKSLGGGGFGGG